MSDHDRKNIEQQVAVIRQNINVLSLIEALENHVIHGAEMTNTQVSAALALLKKTLPDIQALSGKNNTAEQTDTVSHEEALNALE